MRELKENIYKLIFSQYLGDKNELALNFQWTKEVISNLKEFQKPKKKIRTHYNYV